MARNQLFLSTVSAECLSNRDRLSHEAPIALRHLRADGQGL